MVSLTDIAHELMIILGIILLVIGCIGNVLNLFVFGSWIRSSSSRRNGINGSSNGPLYLFTASACNLVVISYPLIVRIIFDGYGNLVTYNNALFVCKLRFFSLQTVHLISLSCTCLATLDRYLLSSRNVRLREMSFTSRQTKQFIAIISIILSIHSIPIAIYYDVVNNQCAFVSQIYSLYYLFMVIILLYGIIPAVFLLVFGSLSLAQIKAATGLMNRRDRQLSHMHLIQSVSVVISSLPYCIYNIYASSLFANTLNVTKTPTELFCEYLAILMFYIHSSINFYIFFFSTPNFRKHLKKIFMRNQRLLNENQVYPLQLDPTHRTTLLPTIVR